MASNDYERLGVFGQKTPPLLQHIHNILNSYSDRQILKELTQNAEDAGATTVQFLYDVREFCTEKLYHDSLGPHQGSALYSYNNAYFKPHDWERIQRPSDSGKKKDPLKVGRFGIGFVSVYHMTDVPSVLSGSYLAYMDPEENIFSTTHGPCKTGFRFVLDDKTENHLSIVNDQAYNHQFEPYNNVFDDITVVPGEFRTINFEGTLFRFPLRKQKSKISNNIYSNEKMHELLSSFADDASLILLFLKNIETVKVFTRNPGPEKTLLISATLSDDTAGHVRTARRRICDGVKDQQKQRQKEDLTESYKMTINAWSGPDGGNESNWFVCTYISWPQDIDIQIASSEECLIAWAGAAMSLDSVEVKGRSFCFLPLPPEESSTCLPVHVNGAFAVSPDRRSIKWPSDRNVDNSALWNQYLVGKVLPKAYAKLIVDAVKIEMEGYHLVECVYKAWPDVTKQLGHWRVLVEPMMQLLKGEKVFFTKASGGIWIDASEAVFDNVCKGPVHKTLISLLIKLNKPVVSPPDHVYKAVKEYIDGNVDEVTPKYTRQCIRNLPLDDVDRKDKLLLLEYILQDKCYTDLGGITLLPLADKTFTTFECPENESCEIYITTKLYPIDLFFNLKKKFLDDEDDIVKSVQQDMEDIASSNKIRKYGLPQITHLTVDAVVRIVRETLPTNWQRCQEVKWTPGQNQHPPTTWLELCWDVLNNDFKENLQTFPQLPLIPNRVADNAMEIKLLPLKKNSCLVSARAPHTSMDLEVGTVIERIGLKVVYLQAYIAKHPQLYVEGFVHYPTPGGVVNALKALPMLEISRSLNDLSHTDKRILRDFMSEIPANSVERRSEEFQRYCMLPIFRSFPDKKLVPASNICDVVKATELPDFATTEKMIGLYDSTDDRLLSLLQLRTCSRDEAICQMLDVPSNDIEQLIKWIIERWGNNQNVYLLSKLKTTLFLKTSEGKMKRPCDLFDPTDGVVATLWDESEAMFPEEYTDKEHIHILKVLGLKDRQDITVNDVILRARRIEDNGERDKALCLLKLLNERADLISTGLRYIKWVPVLCKPTFYPLIWGCIEMVARPTEVLSSKHINIVGSSTALIDSNGTVLTNNILANFAWNEVPHVSLVIQQLNICISSWADGNSDFNNADEIKILCEIYTYLEEHLEEDIKEELSRMSWIWQGNKFVEARKVSIKSMKFDMAPYVYHVPDVFTKFELLFLSCGAHMQMDSNTNAMLDIIQEIKDKHTKTNPTEEEVQEDRQFVIRIICNIFSENIENEMVNNFLTKVLLPEDNTESLRLYPVSEMCYCDLDEYENEDLPDDDQSSPVLLTHGDIPRNVCIRLGVIPLTRRLADAEEFDGMEQTGQSESLTIRLRNILQGYEASDLPKELIQNADDAKATEVRFLIDFRQNQNCEGRLLDPGMSRCQGPALWVYNNSTFSQEDFQNIKRLGSQSKMTIREKIGRFGLGFNSVYHLTDVPSFISGDRLIFFDPHAIHLGKQIRDKTKLGISLNFAKSTKKLSWFKGQFELYNGVFDCDLRPTSEWKSYSGTLFRFPLRTELQASDNEIKNEPCNDEKIHNILKHFHKEADDILLFTNHVKKVSLHMLHQNESDPQKTTELFRISTTQEGKLVTASMITSQNGKNYFGIDRTVTKQWIMQNSDGSRDTKALVRSEMGHGLNNFGSHDVKELDAEELAKSDDGVRHGLNPCGGVACPLGENTSNGSVYCFLPLSIPLSDLPVYINASFSLSSDRRNLKKIGAGDEKSLDIEWNNAIMKHTISKAYVDLLSKGECGNIVSDDAARKTDVFYFWPKTHVHSDYKLIVKEFYRMVVDGDGHNLPLIFRNNGRWYDFKHLVLIDPDLKKIPEVGNYATKILVQLFDSEQTAVLDIPEWLYEILSSDYGSALGRQIVSRDQFFRNYFFPNIGKFEDYIIDSILLHVLKADECQDLLKSTACIPSKPNGKTRKRISELIYPTGIASKMYSADENVFPFGDYDDVIIQKLINLGLRKDVQWSDVIERARTVQTLQEISAENAMARTRAIVNYTYHKHENDKNGIVEFREDIKNIRFFPSMMKPKDYPISWFTDRGQLFSPRDLYTEAHVDLVGSLHPIIDETMSGFQKGKSVTGLFGISEHPSIADIFKQLDKVIECDINKSNINGVKRIYLSILERISRSEIDSNTDIVERLKNRPTVLVDDCFVNGNVCARHGLAGNIYGLLYEFPTELEVFLGFFHKLGVLERFGVSDYINAIYRLNNKYQETRSGVQIKPLDGKDIDAVIQILTHLQNEINEQSDVQDLLIPDVENILRPVQELCYDDISCVSLSEDVKICSGKISQEMAKRLGIKDIRTRTIMNLSCCDLFSEFGQHEELTSRIKLILEGYPLGVSIFREILQNADDAGASRLSLILDHRIHPLGKLPSNNWKHLQGPALCIYNDATFSDDDIRGIQKLGSGSKENQAEKTGQCGIGFNVAYRITDCPSFISNGETLCLFDPNLEYAPGATSIKPGLITNKQKLQKFRKMFPDAIKCYLNEFEQDFPQRGGTIFRLPLRSKEMIKLSKISKLCTTEGKINNLLEEFKNETTEILLFLKNIRRISVHEIGTCGGLIERYSVESFIRNEDKEERRSFFGKIKEMSLNTPAFNDINQIDCSYVMEIICHNTNHKGRKNHWLISQSFGFGGIDQCHLSRPHLPIGGVGTLLPEKRRPRNFCHNDSVYCFLPLPIKSGLPVIVNGHFCLGPESRRDIWHYDDGKNDPRDVWNITLINVVVCRAYLNLLNEFTKRTGLSGSPRDEISDKILKRRLNDYHRLFPNPSKTTSSLWKKLAILFYKRIVDQKEPILPLLKQNNSGQEDTTHYEIRWYSPVENEFDRGYFYEVDPTKKEPAMALKSILIRLGINVLYAHFCIHNFFLAAGCEVFSITPDRVCHFLSMNHGKCTLAELPLPIAETTLRREEDLKLVMEYIRTETTDLHPHGLPLVLTDDNSLNVCDCQDKSRKPVLRNDFQSFKCTFGRRKIFYCHFAHVFPDCKHEFLHKEFMEYFEASEFVFLSLTDIEKRLAKHLNRVKYRNRSYIHYESEIVQRDWIKDLWECIISSWQLHNASIVSSGCKSSVVVSPNPPDAEYLIRTFGDWAILPVIFKDEAYLVPLSMAATVIGDFTHDRQLHQIFVAKLNCPKLHNELLPESRLTPLLSSPKHPERIVYLLHFLQKDDDRCFTVLKSGDFAYLLNYFERNINDLKTIPFSRLKELKLFETISGDIVNLTNTSVVVIVHDDIPENDQSIWLSKTQTVFIKKLPQLKKLYNKLGFVEKPSLQVYTKFIFPVFCDFTDEGREAHLKWIRGKRLYDDELCEIGLTSTPIIKTDRGFQRVDTLYDSQIKLFKIMLPMHSFLPSPYDAIEWREFLQNLGLISEVSYAMFKEFARMIECQIPSKAEQSQVKEKSEVLVEAYLNAIDNSQLQHDSSLLNDISTIKFMLPDNLEVFGDTFESSKNGVMFRGSVTSTDAHLVWTTKPVLPAYASIRLSKDVATQLGVIQDPSDEDVLVHLKNISKSTEIRLNDDVKNEIQEVFKEIYAFLKRKCDCNNQVTCRVCHYIAKLIPPKLAFVLVHDNLNRNVLVQASMVSGYVPKELKNVLVPYIYELPKEIANYGTIFKAAGMTDEVSAKQYSFVLEAVLKSDKTGERNPNFKTLVAACVRSIFEMLKRSKEEGIELNFKSVDHLYFPDKEHMLISSCDLVFADICRYERRVKDDAVRLFIGFEECNLDESYFKYLDVLPHRLQLKKMSKEFREKIAECEDCTETENGHCEFLDTYQAVLTSHEFRQGLMRLINHEKRQLDFDKDITEQKIEKLFGQSFKLHCRETITTQLYCRDALLTDSEETADCCLVETENGVHNYDLYIRHQKHPGSKKFTKMLVTVINGMLGNEISDIISLHGIVTEPSPFTIDDILSQFDITPYGGRSDEPNLGDRVPMEYLYLLLEDPFETFYPGEIVAYQLSDNDDAENESNYIYAKIVCKITPGNVDRLTCTYSIGIGDKEEGPIDVSVLDIFKFRKPERATSYEGTMAEVKKQIKDNLEEIWRLPDPEKRKAIKRILLKWHPDKNEEDRKEYYTEIFQYIMEVIKRLKAYDDDFFDKVNRRAQRDRTFYNTSYRYFTTQPRTPQPNLSEARRWLRQAQFDLSAAQTEDNRFCEWICFKCSQAAEKAFKAAQYAIDGYKNYTHLIRSLANDVRTRIDLTSAATRLANVAGDQMSMRYPDMLSGDKIPNDVYTIKEAEESISAAQEIVDGISEFINK